MDDRDRLAAGFVTHRAARTSPRHRVDTLSHRILPRLTLSYRAKLQTSQPGFGLPPLFVPIATLALAWLDTVMACLGDT